MVPEVPAPAKLPALSFGLAPLLELIPALHWCNGSKWIYFQMMSSITCTFSRERIWFIQIFRSFFSPLAICYLCLQSLDKSFIGKNTYNLQWCQHHFQCRHHCSCQNRPWCRHQRNQSKCSSAGVIFGGIPEIRHRHGTIAGIAPPLVGAK